MTILASTKPHASAIRLNRSRESACFEVKWAPVIVNVMSWGLTQYWE